MDDSNKHYRDGKPTIASGACGRALAERRKVHFEPLPLIGSGRVGPGARGLGYGGGKRHRRVLKDNILGVTQPAIRRLARRGGVRRMTEAIYDETRIAIKAHLSEILRQCVIVLESSPRDRKTVTVRDVVFVLKRLGTPVAGFGLAET